MLENLKSYRHSKSFYSEEFHCIYIIKLFVANNELFCRVITEINDYFNMMAVCF